MSRKGIVFGIVIVFLLGSFASGVTINLKDSVQISSRGNTLYVGGSGPGNYTTIQSAINDANPGDTVFVYNGTYYENVVVDKSINLIGENRDTTIIDGGEDWSCVYINASWVNISGFTIQNRSHGIYTGLATNINISKNIISNNSNGINPGHASTISDNIFINNTEGIQAWDDKNCTITNNIFLNNSYCGINFYGSCWYNTISKNHFIDNIYAIILQVECLGFPNYNSIYHNNIFHGNCGDGGFHNIWDDGYPSGGNYWSDFDEPIEGAWDNNSDGIVDSQYNRDRYPLINPWGENLPVANFTYSVNESPVYFDGSSSYDRDGEIISYHWDFGDGTTGNGETIYYKYCDIGTYDVTLTVTDDDGYSGNITHSIEVKVPNQPPEASFINGPTSGRAGTSYSYKFNSTDPDNDDVYYYIDWGDNTHEDWFGPFPSGFEVAKSHVFVNQGTYNIYAKAKDVCGSESPWGTLTVTMPRNKPFNSDFNLLEWLFEQFPNAFPLLRYILGLQ